MDDVAIKVDRVSKTFKLPHEKQTSIKGALINLARGGRRSYERQQVLKDVSFEIKKGEFFGIVGRNGSGKSTLLKMLAGIYTPTKGSIQVNGKLTPFIELGVGFNPELTGRENVFLNGALLGFSRKEMSHMYHDIVAFAELEKFMDQKLKNYSSGMQVRLAFSIAIRVNTDLLILDEVLAVGDERFQDKCLTVFEDFKKRKQTIVLVTHDMNSVKRFCDRAIVVDEGNLVYTGTPQEAAQKYSELNFPQVFEDETAAQDAQHVRARIHQVNGKQSSGALLKSGDTVRLRAKWDHNPAARNVGVAVFTESGQYVFGTNTLVDGVKVAGNELDYELKLNLGAGNYYVQVGVFGESDSEKIYFSHRAVSFKIVQSSGWQGLTNLEHAWK